MTERDELHKQTCGQVYQLSMANMYEIQAIIEDMLRHPQVDPEPEPDLDRDPTGSGSWMESRYVTKKNGKRYGPYFYECTRVAGRKKLVKYWGKEKP